MSKRKSKKRGKTERLRVARHPSVDVGEVLDIGQRLINEGRAEEAIELLAPLVEANPGEPDLRYILGYALFMEGETWDALEECEHAQRQSRDPGYWWLLGFMYADAELHAHALNALRRASRRLDLAPPEVHERLTEVLADLEERVAQLSVRLGVSARQVVEGMLAMEEGIRALNQERYVASVAASLRAIRALGDWPPPHNNLSLALFYDGRPQEAVAAAQRVLDADPNNVQALSNGIRFLAWSDRVEEARRLWSRLVHLKPDGATERFKAAEAAALLGEDESVHRLLRPLDNKEAEQAFTPSFVAEIQFYLAVAEANLGRRGAKRRLRAVREFYPQASDFLQALDRGQPGPGWSERYPYLSSAEFLPRPAMEEWLALVSRMDRLSERRLHTQVARFVRRYPQMVLLAEKMIWEEEMAEAGLAALIVLDTASARAALRRFGLSQAGDDALRMQALYHLVEVGEIEPGTQLRVWRNGEWSDMLMQRYDISDEYVSEYPPEIVELLDAGSEALREHEYERAERLFRQAIELEPQAKEAYHDLSIVYSQQDRPEQAREVLRAVLEVDPTYVMARCSLALYLLDDDDIQGAQSMLAPIAQVTQFSPREMAFYSYAQAHLLVAQEEFEAARSPLLMALDLLPDYEPARDLLERIDFRRSLSVVWEREAERQQRRRIRLQAKLSTLDPGLAEALSLYSKEVLTGMGRTVIPWGGWSAYRKAELIAAIVSVLTDVDLLQDVFEALEEQERAALREVMEQGGKMRWQDFEARYDSDIDESPYWNWHPPKSVMGRLRARGLLVEAKVEGELWVVVPVEVREALAK